MTFIEKISNAAEIFKNKFVIITIICLLSSVVSVFCIPLFINQAFAPEVINEQINLYFSGGIKAEEVTAALIWMFQLSIISGSLLITTYIFKYTFTKSIFNLKKWQDWKFLLYASVIPMISIDLIKKIDLSSNLNLFNNFIANFLITLICAFIIIIISSLFIDKEKEEAPISLDA